MAMWDWELATYLRSKGVSIIAPYTLEQSKTVCRALAVKRELRSTRFLVFQDNPGEGQQASIFKRFYWWEDECTQRMRDKFGVQIVRKSFKELGERAGSISDECAEAAHSRLPIAAQGVSPRAVNSALKLYLAVKHELDNDPSVRAVGINCLNESHFSDTTPCLAWNLLFEERRLIWGCEADTMSMITKYILYHSLLAPIMMTNMYPFLMGQAALKHERIANFPQIPEGRNCVLVAHCGYLGVLPVSFASEWALKPKVLRIVNDNATALDARLATGDITLAKLGPMFDKLTIAEGKLEGYAQYPGSDCLNGGVIRVNDGHKLMTSLPSHHCLLLAGHHQADIGHIAGIFGLQIERI
jgi:L-fucose isomerase-like protein